MKCKYRSLKEMLKKIIYLYGDNYKKLSAALV